MRKPDRTIRLGLDTSGSAPVIVVRPEEEEQGKAVAYRNFKVAFAGDGTMPGQWAVGLWNKEGDGPAAISPFKNGEMVIAGFRDNPVEVRAKELGEFGYWVWCIDDDGAAHFLDPKLVIRNPDKRLSAYTDAIAAAFEDMATHTSKSAALMQEASDLIRESGLDDEAD